MNKHLINNDFELEVPEGFRVLNPEEVVAFCGKSNDYNFVIRKEDVHCAILVSGQKTNFLNRHLTLSKMIDATISTLKNFTTNFQFIGDTNRIIDNVPAEGFRYENIVKQTPQIGEYLLFKYKKMNYALCVLGRPDTFDDNYHFFKEVIDSISFK